MKNASGNALFLVLIGLALFAALSYAVTQTGRSAGNIDKEKAQLLAAQLTQQTAQMRSAVQRLMLFNDCADNELSFYSTARPDISQYAYPTPDETTIRPECNLYDPAGGGLAPQFVPKDIGLLEDYMQASYTSEAAKDRHARSYLPMRMYVKGVGRDYTSTTDYESNEIGVGVQMLSKEVCIAINEKVGIDNPGGDPPTNASIFANFAAGNTPISTGRASSVANRSYAIPELDGHREGCFYNPNPSSWINSARYTFYSVLYAG